MALRLLGIVEEGRATLKHSVPHPLRWADWKQNGELITGSAKTRTGGE